MIVTLGEPRADDDERIFHPIISGGGKELGRYYPFERMAVVWGDVIKSNIQAAVKSRFGQSRFEDGKATGEITFEFDVDKSELV